MRFPENSLPVSGTRRSGFTVVEMFFALMIGLGVIAAALSGYLFISKNGKALEAQIEFSNKARTLQTQLSNIIEGGHHVSLDGDDVLTVYDAGEDETTFYESSLEYTGHQLVYTDPEGNSRVLCDYVSPAVDNDGVELEKFRRLSGRAVAVNLFVGDPAGEPDTTGPGRQGLVVMLVATCHDLRRRLL